MKDAMRRYYSLQPVIEVLRIDRYCVRITFQVTSLILVPFSSSEMIKGV